jgi:hypothetical protein
MGDTPISRCEEIAIDLGLNADPLTLDRSGDTLEGLCPAPQGSAMRVAFAATIGALALLLGACDFRATCGACEVPPRPPTPEQVFLGPAKGGTQVPADTPATVTVSGRVTFERLAVTPSGLGPTPASQPAAFVTVEAVTLAPPPVVASATTNASGDYTLSFTTQSPFYIRARVESGDDRVYFPAAPTPFVYGFSSSWRSPQQAMHVVDLHASATARHNPAGAFAILDTMMRLRAAAASFPALGELDAFWANGDARLGDWNLLPGTNTTETTENGPNGRPAIFLRGGTNADPLNTDHDEFDETVIAHEWASFLQLTHSRDNNFGGPHAGEELIPTAAYSEGVVTAIGCALLGTNLYRDTVGYPGGATQVQFEFDCESGLLPGNGDAYTNEFRVARIVWDILDGGAGSPADTDSDPAAASLADFFSGFAALRTRTGDFEVAWLASLMQQLVDDAALSLADADTLAASQGAVFPPVGGSDSFPTPLVIGDPAQAGNLDAWSGTNPNPDLGPQANAVYRMVVAAPQTVQIDVLNLAVGYDPDEHRLDLTVHALDRTLVASSTGAVQHKQVQASLPAGTYIIRVQHRPASQGASMPADFTILAQ